MWLWKMGKGVKRSRGRGVMWYGMWAGEGASESSSKIGRANLRWKESGGGGRSETRCLCGVCLGATDVMSRRNCGGVRRLTWLFTGVDADSKAGASRLWRQLKRCVIVESFQEWRDQRWIEGKDGSKKAEGALLCTQRTPARTRDQAR